MRFALCSLLLPICVNQRKSAVKYLLKSFDPVIVRNREVFVCRLSRQTKFEILCALCVSAVNHYLRKSAVNISFPDLAPFAPLR